MKRKSKRKRNPFPSSIPQVDQNIFEDDIRELDSVRKAYFKMIEYLELCENDEDFKSLMKDRKTRNEIENLFEMIAGGADDIQLAINNTLNKVIELSYWMSKKFGLEI